MITTRKFQYTDEDGDVETFYHIQGICHCFCYSGCYPDTLKAIDSIEDDCIENINVEFRSGKQLICDMIEMLLDAGKIKEVPND